MADLTGSERAEYVNDMFTRIAYRYDLMNRLMTFGQDQRWRKEVIRFARLEKDGRVLDIGAGTGDLAREALRQCRECQVTAADFTLEMMMAGREGHKPENQISWLAADALRIPAQDNQFDTIVSAFLLRNVSDLKEALGEQYRVLKPGGRMVCLDTTPPPGGFMGILIKFHLHTIIPLLGSWLSGNAPAYHYLPDSTEAFLQPAQLAALLAETGFKGVSFRQYMFGTVAIHWGEK